MMWRLNFLVIFCCVVLQNSYMLYYICPMHTIFTVFVYACLGIAPHLNKTPAWMWTKWVGRAGDELGATAAATKPAATAHSVRGLLHLPCASPATPPLLVVDRTQQHSMPRQLGSLQVCRSQSLRA